MFDKRHCPCLICLKRPMCNNRKLSTNGTFNLACGLLAEYISPKGKSIPLRYIQVKKIFPRLYGIRSEHNGVLGKWLYIPSWVYRLYPPHLSTK